MTVVADPQLFADVAVRSTAVLAIALVLAHALKNRLRFRSLLWAIAFAVLALTLVPTRYALQIPVPRDAPALGAPVVYETEPGFDALQVSSLPRPFEATPALVSALLLAAGLASGAFRKFKTWQIVRRAEQVADKLVVSMCYEIGERLGITEAPTILLSDRIASPFIAGVMTPAIVVPAIMGNGLDEAGWRAVLSHELAHLKNRDHLRIGIYLIVRSLFVWHPLVWLALRDADLAMEQLCDNVAINDLSVPAGGYESLLSAYHAAARAAMATRFFGSGMLKERLRSLRLQMSRDGWRQYAALALLPLPVLPLGKLAPANPADPKQISNDEVLCVATNPGADHSILVRYALDGKGPVLTIDRSVSCPEVSHDGKKICYAKTNPMTNDYDLYISDADGQNESLLVSSPQRELCGVFSPDDRSVVYSTEFGTKWRTGLCDIATGKRRWLTSENGTFWEASWHQSGKRIVFTSKMPEPELTELHQKIYSINIDGMELKRLTTTPWEDAGGRYSPNGRYLVFIRGNFGKMDVFVLDLKTMEAWPITSQPENCGGPRFLPNGDIVYGINTGVNQNYIVTSDLWGRRRQIIGEGIQVGCR